MMKKVKSVLSALLMGLPFMLFAQVPGADKPNASVLTRGAALLFKNVPTKLSVADQNYIYQQMNFVLSADTSQPFAADQESLEYPFAAHVWPTDMNKDGKEEVFIVFGNSFTSGMTGSSVVLYVKNTAGKYNLNLGFPGSPSALPTSNLGYRDLLIGGPGFTFPVWRWNGKQYALFKTIKNEALEKIRVTEIEELSKQYTSTIKN